MSTNILENVLAEFARLALIPRKSGHEKAVSDFLYERAKALGLTVVQDKVNNLIIDKPAASGCESMPRVILQCHMDMVCVAKEGRPYNALTDAIKLVRDENFLRADGTSLGADDGIGIATALYLLQADFAHGPLRVILTVDEENGMTGAQALEAGYLDAAYLINCDSENFDVVTLGSAGSVNLDAIRQVHWQEPQKTDTYKLAIHSLLGGHSGMDIHRGRANAIQLIGLLLNFMREASMEFEIASIKGGQSRNVIPSAAECIVKIGAMDTYRMSNAVAKMNRYMHDVYETVEPSYYIEAAPAGNVMQVMDEASTHAIIDYLLLAPNGPLRMGTPQPPMVETSSNLGVAKLEDNNLVLQFFPRSSVAIQLKTIGSYHKALAQRCGFSVKCSAPSPSWPVKEGGVLTQKAAELFRKICGAEPRLEAVHAGLECGWFHQKNPNLEMISLGPTILDIHSPEEKIDLRTVEPHVQMLQQLLESLKE